MRKIIREIIKERIEGFKDSDLLDFDDIGVDTISDLDAETKERKQADVYSYTVVLERTDGTHVKAMIHFASISIMKEWIPIFQQASLLDNYMLEVTEHVLINPNYVAQDLFSHFPDADVIKIHDFTDLLLINFDGSVSDAYKTLCHNIVNFRPEKDGQARRQWSLFNSPSLDQTGEFTLTKDGKVSYLSLDFLYQDF
jgi:hypothetical protein